MLIEKLRALYDKYGNKAVYPPLFLFFLALHLLGSQGMVYPAVDPNELSVIAISQFFIGKSWTGVMCASDYYYGFLQGILYIPAMLFFDSPRLQYAAVIFINSLLASLVPVIAYAVSCRMRIEKIWKRLVIAFVAGGYCCLFAHTKFAWTETVSVLMPWIIILLTFRCAECKGKASRFFMSILLGVTCAAALAAHTRLISIVIALIIALVLDRVFFGKKRVYMSCFLPAFIVVGAAVAYISCFLQQNIWSCADPTQLKNTAAEFFANLGERLADNGAERIVSTLCGQFYYFVTSTWGIGAVFFCLFGAVVSACIKHKRKKEPQTYDSEVSFFSFFTFCSVILTILYSTMYRFGSDGFYTYQDTTMFGRFLDGVIPLAMVFVLIMLFTHSISLNKILGAVAVLGVIYLAFSVTAVPVIMECEATRIAPVLALYPLRIGAASQQLLNFDSLLLTMSMTFCVMAVLIVIVSCAKRYRSLIISLIMTAITAYSLIFISAVYLPICRSESVAKNSSVCRISESIFNQAGAPTVTAYNISRHNALMLQFLNRHVTVRITYEIESIPENCFLVINKGEDVTALENSRTPFLLVAESEDLRLYAYGERAVAYMQSQSASESEKESEQEALIPEKTSAATETSPPVTTPEVTTAPPVTTTERTPKISTYTTPAVITLPADSIGDDYDWAVIE